MPDVVMRDVAMPDVAMDRVASFGMTRIDPARSETRYAMAWTVPGSLVHEGRRIVKVGSASAFGSEPRLAQVGSVRSIEAGNGVAGLMPVGRMLVGSARAIAVGGLLSAVGGSAALRIRRTESSPQQPLARSSC